MKGRDIVGDVHGELSALLALLDVLGYERRAGSWRAPDGRGLVFVGDLVDRGPDPLGVLRLVRDLEQAGVALCAMGNHEYNCLCWHAETDPELAPPLAVERAKSDPACRWLRSHDEKHLRQARATLEAFASVSPDEVRSHLDWMQGLPLLVDLGGVRVVHAAWVEPCVSRLKALGRPVEVDGGTGVGITPEFLQRSWGAWKHPSRTEEFELVEYLIKGPEIDLPPGLSYADKEGTVRTRARLRWWRPREELLSAPWEGRCLFPAGFAAAGEGGPVDPEALGPVGYPEGEPPVVVGHYWESGVGQPWSPLAGCVDWSVAKGGRMCAYRWEGERELRSDRFVAVSGPVV